MSESGLIDGRFELLEQAARGGMGEVHRALDRTTQSIVAVKLIRQQDDEAVRRFSQEARVLGEIEHAHVVRYIAHGRMARGEPYLVMEWLEGETLSGRLARGPLSIEETYELGRRLASGLGAAHTRGIIHRDVKPGNVFLVDGQISRAKLIDFGIARHEASNSLLTMTGTLMGTPGYMAPEQFAGAPVDAAADQFSFCVALFEALYGQRPFPGATVMAVADLVLRGELHAAAGDWLFYLDADETIPPPLADQLPKTLLEKQRFAYFFNDHLTGLHNAEYLRFISKSGLDGGYIWAGMVMLRQSRLSVSPVSKAEFDHIVALSKA